MSHMIYLNLKKMNSRLFFVIVVSLLLLSCKTNIENYAIPKNIKRDFNKGGNYKAAVIIPQAGCSGCVSTAEEFTRQNINNSQILFIFTKIVSEKELRAKLKIDTEPPSNCYFDVDNKYSFPVGCEGSEYPLLVYFSKGKEMEVESASPLNPGAYERLLNRIILISPKYDIEKIIEAKPLEKGISELVKGIKYIQIKSNNKIFSSLRHAVLDDDKIIVSEDQSVYVIDSTGGILSKIGVQGRGPEEYTQLNGGLFQVDKTKNEILLPDMAGRKVLIYDYEGKLKRIIESKYYIDDAASLSDSLYCLKVQPVQDDMKRAIAMVVVNRHGVVKNKFTSSLLSDFNFFALCNLEKQNDGVFYREPYNDTVYKITPQLTRGVAGIITLGRLKPPVDIYRNISLWGAHISKYIFNYYLIHDSGRVYFSIYYNLHVYCGEFNTAGGVQSLWFGGPQNEGIKDDIDFGPPFTPFLNIKDGIMIDFIEPIELLKPKYSNVKKGSSLDLIRSSVKQEDNPIIRIVKL